MACTEFWHVRECPGGATHEFKGCHRCGEALETTQAGDLLLVVATAEVVSRFGVPEGHLLVHDECYLADTISYELA